jgi:hypothetical protein
MKLFVALTLTFILSNGYAAEKTQYRLFDTECKVTSPRPDGVIVNKGVLLEYHCVSDSKAVSCAIKTQSGELMDDKKSANLRVFKILQKSPTVEAWQDKDGGIMLLTLKSKRFYTASTQILPNGLFNRSCIGTIK